MLGAIGKEEKALTLLGQRGSFDLWAQKLESLSLPEKVDGSHHLSKYIVHIA